MVLIGQILTKVKFFLSKKKGWSLTEGKIDAKISLKNDILFDITAKLATVRVIAFQSCKVLV